MRGPKNGVLEFSISHHKSTKTNSRLRLRLRLRRAMETNEAFDRFFGRETMTQSPTRRETSETSEIFSRFNDAMFGKTSLKWSDNRSEEELEKLVVHFEEGGSRALTGSKRGRKALKALQKRTLRGAMVCVECCSQEKRVNDWKSFADFPVLNCLAHCLFLKRTLEGRDEDDEDEGEDEDTSEGFNAVDDPTKPAMLRYWGDKRVKSARVNLDLLNNLIVLVEDEEARRKIPSFCGDLMRSCEEYFCNLTNEDCSDERQKEDNEKDTILTEIPLSFWKKMDVVKNQLDEEVATLTPAEFIWGYFKLKKPCIIRGYAKEEKKWELCDFCRTTRFLIDANVGGTRVVPIEYRCSGNSRGCGVIRLSKFKKTLDKSNEYDKKVAYRW